MLVGTREAIKALITLQKSIKTNPVPSATPPLTKAGPDRHCPTCKQAITATSLTVTPPGGYYFDPRTSNDSAALDKLR